MVNSLQTVTINIIIKHIHLRLCVHFLQGKMIDLTLDVTQ